MVTTAKDFYRMLNKCSHTSSPAGYIFDFIRDYKRYMCAYMCVVQHAISLISLHVEARFTRFPVLVNAFRSQPQFDRYRRTITNVTWLTPTAYRTAVLSCRYIGLAVSIIVETYGWPCELMTSNITNYQSRLHRRGWSRKIDTAGRPYQSRSAKQTRKLVLRDRYSRTMHNGVSQPSAFRWDIKRTPSCTIASLRTKITHNFTVGKWKFVEIKQYYNN